MTTTEGEIKALEGKRSNTRRRVLYRWPADYAGPHAGTVTDHGRELTPAELEAALASGAQVIEVKYDSRWGDWRPEITPAGMTGIIGGEGDDE